MILTFSSHLRTETDPQVIATLTRKGWIEAGLDVQLTAPSDPRVTDGYPVGYPESVKPLTASAIPEHTVMTQAEVDTLKSTHAVAIAAYNSRPWIPPSVTRRQLFLWLLGSKGLTRAQIRSMITDESGLIEFDEAISFERNHPLVAQLATALNMTKEDVDAGFIAASQL
jgi:hypothetical protein